MHTLLALIIAGCVSGAIYAVLGVGLVVSYSTTKVFNFGHGAVAFATAYVFFQLESGFHWPMVPALVVSAGLFAPLVGLAWERLVFRNLKSADDISRMVCGIGVLLVMPAAVLWLGDVGRTDLHLHLVDTSNLGAVPGVGPNPPTNYPIGSGVVVSSNQLIALGVGVVLCALCWVIMRFSRLGLEMRAAVDSPELAGLRRIEGDRVSLVAWFISFTAAGIAGIVAAPIVGSFGLNPDNYTLALFVAITCFVIARMRSVPIAFLSGLAIGALTNLSQGYLTAQYLGGVGSWIQSVSGLSSSVPYLLLLLSLLVFRRQSVLTKVAGSVAAVAPPPAYLGDLRPFRRRLPWIVAGLLVVGYVMGPADVVWRELMISGAAMGIIFLSITLLTGLSGVISFAQAGLAGLAAMFAGYLTNHGWPFALALLFAALLCMAAGAIIALPGLRFGGLPAAFTTLALALLVSTIILQIPALSDDGQGWSISRPSLGPLHFSSDKVYFVLVALFFLAAFWFVCHLRASSTGRAILAVRTAEPAAIASGVSPVVVRMLIFTAAAGLAAIGGVLLATVGGAVEAATFAPTVGFFWLAAVVIFGVSRPGGAAIAAFAGSITPYFLEHGIHVGHFGWNGTGSGGPTSTLLPDVLFGLAAIGLSKHPYGVLSQSAERRYRRRHGVSPVKSRPSLAPSASDTTASAGAVNAGSSSGQPAILEVRDLVAGYGELDILKRVTFSVSPGAVVALVGPNGGGKSTIAATVGGLLPVKSGTMRFSGEDIAHLSITRRSKRGLALVPESRGVFPSLSVEENLAVWLGSQRADEAYRRFPSLAARRTTAAGNLSGGEQQMLSLAPFFVQRPRLLIVDEPTLGLAPIVADEVVSALRDLRDAGVALLLTEEKARAVLGLADEIGAVSRGRLLWLRPAVEVRERDLQDVYLGSVADAPVVGADRPDHGTQPEALQQAQSLQ